ncbi:MAG TPA: hypothetical protein VKY65_08995 [Alphaproteobacteria bacterium]|nr:hypothetical protein [Alphaproteobacteria bacterium]
MALAIDTFSNSSGGNAFFKAVGHPLVLPKAKALLARLAARGPVALYDPQGFAEGFAALHPLASLPLAGVFVQKIEEVGRSMLGCAAQPVTELPSSSARSLLVLAFDAARAIAHIRALVPEGMEVASLDEMKLPAAMLSNAGRYLDPLNFATNFAFFRDADGHHTRLVTANYWAGYGAARTRLWCCLFDESGAEIAAWDEPLPEGVGAVVIDSRALRARFSLPPFTGQLFLHVVGAAGHDVVKYALDTYGDDAAMLSCTHDANAWPADLYAGLPAPREGERVVLWVQNSHPTPIPRRGVGLNPMGAAETAWLEREIPPFATYALDTRELLPDCGWPGQIEIRAGKHFVRPRYEVIARDGRRRIAHPNVERTDLKPDPRIPELGNLMGKGFLLPAPVLPPERFRTIVQPTPMATAQANLPIALLVYDSEGRERARRPLGCLARRESVAVDLAELVNGGAALAGGYGHLELVYDFAAGGEADGWLHGLFRYEDKASGHAAETSFGAHVFNTVLTYKSEPQSYAGPAPGLSTRLFLRLGPAPLDTLCHLIYPASTVWHPRSSTDLVLHDGSGAEIARRHIEIPCSGSRLWRYRETFDEAERRRAGAGAYVIVRDATCRLFGYHGLLGRDGAFSLDHMFGF